MTIANDKLGHHVRIIHSNTLVNAGVLSSGFANVISADTYAFHGSGERSVRREYVGETAPSTNYSTVVGGGDEYLMLTYASNVVTTAHRYVYQYDVWRKYLTDYIPIVDSIAITAQAGSAWHGMRIKSRSASQTITGEHTGLYIETEATGTSSSGNHTGLKIETYVVATATIGDHYGAAIYTYDDRVGSNQLHVLRLEHNGANVGNAFLGCFAAANKMTYLIESSTTNDTWMSVTTTPTCSGVGGWYKVKHGGYTRYIQLWTTIA
ncbi:MAG TPA: hypothetical protein VMV77_16765 [Bacteroidales bacterium]|nr:hypothetical protein [Bacteroidales bacterium]